MPISCESQYIIDSMTELCFITVDVATGVYHIGLDIDGMVDADNAGVRVNIEEEVKRLYRQWRPTVDTNEQMYISLNGVLGSEHQFSEQISYTAEKIINAYRKSNGNPDPIGGSIVEDGTNLYIGSEDDMLQESNIIHYLEQNRPQAWMRMLEDQFNDFADVYDKINCNQYMEWENGRKELMMQRMHEQLEYFNSIIPSKFIPKVSRKEIKRGQKILKKGIKTFTNMFGQKDIHAFITGDDFIIHGNRYDYRVSKKQNLITYSYNPSASHIPYRLQLLTKDGVVLADGCIVFDNTPVIDQLIAMMLHIKNGNEDEIIKTTVFSQLTDAYHNETYIAELKKRQKKEIEESGELVDFSRSAFFQEMGRQSDDIKKYRPVLRPIIENVLIDMLNIPKAATRFMISPPMTYEAIQFLEGPQLEQTLLGIEHNK